MGYESKTVMLAVIEFLNSSERAVYDYLIKNVIGLWALR